MGRAKGQIGVRGLRPEAKLALGRCSGHYFAALKMSQGTEWLMRIVSRAVRLNRPFLSDASVAGSFGGRNVFRPARGASRV